MLIDITRFDFSVTGVLHIGAFIGEEFPTYQRMEVKHIIFFEPIVRHFEKLIEKVGKNNASFHNCALGNYDGEATINISSTQYNGREWYQRGDGASSSILKPHKHLTQHPNIAFFQTENVKIHKLDTLIETGHVNISLFNMINIDVQGYELEVFKGAEHALNYIDYILTEVNRDEVYKDCAQVEDIDDFLSDYNFKRIETNWAGDIWGDALYIKGKE